MIPLHVNMQQVIKLYLIVNDDQKMQLFRFIYLFIPNQLYMFRARSSAIIRSN